VSWRRNERCTAQSLWGGRPARWDVHRSNSFLPHGQARPKVGGYIGSQERFLGLETRGFDFIAKIMGASKSAPGASHRLSRIARAYLPVTLVAHVTNSTRIPGLTTPRLTLFLSKTDLSCGATR
jgi:hypothetical protein